MKKMSLIGLLALALTACVDVGGGPGGDSNVSVDAAGAETLQLGAQGAVLDTDVSVVGVETSEVSVTSTGGLVEASIDGSGTIEVDPDGSVSLLSVEAPNDLEYVIFLSDNSASVSGISAPGAIVVGDGDVEVEDLAADIAIQVGSGDVTLTHTDDAIEEIAIQVGSGDVVIEVDADADADIAIFAENISFEGIEFDGVNVAGSAAGSIGAGGSSDNSIGIQVGSGSVIVRGR